MRKMTTEELKTVGKQVLKVFDKICRENNIKYFLSAGSLIGAIRHSGYIPWDDDIDVWMLREDYARFINVVGGGIVNNYKLISIETDPDYYFPFARFCDTRTQLNLRGMREIHDFGVFVDIFPVDNAPPKNEIEGWFAEYKLLRKKVGYTIPNSAHYRDHSLKTIIRRVRRFPKRVIWSPKKFDMYRKQMQDHIQKYNGCDDSYKTVMECINIYGASKAIFPKEIFEEIISVKFENIEVQTLKQYDKFLRITYGDYMQLPPVEKRVSQHHFTAYWKD